MISPRASAAAKWWADRLRGRIEQAAKAHDAGTSTADDEPWLVPGLVDDIGEFEASLAVSVQQELEAFHGGFGLVLRWSTPLESFLQLALHDAELFFIAQEGVELSFMQSVMDLQNDLVRVCTKDGWENVPLPE